MFAEEEQEEEEALEFSLGVGKEEESKYSNGDETPKGPKTEVSFIMYSERGMLFEREAADDVCDWDCDWD